MTEDIGFRKRSSTSPDVGNNRSLHFRSGSLRNPGMIDPIHTPDLDSHCFSSFIRRDRASRNSDSFLEFRLVRVGLDVGLPTLSLMDPGIHELAETNVRDPSVHISDARIQNIVAHGHQSDLSLF